MLLLESIDRLSRLPAEDWNKLKAAIDSKGLRIVALDLPTSHQGMRDTKGDEFTDRMLAAINGMMIEMMAAIARKDYEQRRERQAQGRSPRPRRKAPTKAARWMRICTSACVSCWQPASAFALPPGMPAARQPPCSRSATRWLKGITPTRLHCGHK
ncbi:hypothetical protein GCM10027514_27390 [Azotobacter armeniacus]